MHKQIHWNLKIRFWVPILSPEFEMGRRQSECSSLSLLCLALISCALVYAVLSVVLRPSQLYTASLSRPSSGSVAGESASGGEEESLGGERCCRGIEKLELWGSAVKWGSDFKFNSSGECCKACKAMCTGTDGPCLCDTWVFCGDKKACGSKFGEVCFFFWGL